MPMIFMKRQVTECRPSNVIHANNVSVLCNGVTSVVAVVYILNSVNRSI